MKPHIPNQSGLSGRTRLLLLIFLISLNFSSSAQDSTTPIGTTRTWGTIDGIRFEGMVQGPSATQTPLQVACVFEYTKDDIFKSPPALPTALNGLVHLDNSLNGLLTTIRRDSLFTGRLYETMLLTPPGGLIGAKQLLLIGLGNRADFKPGIMVGIGSVAMREAIRLNISTYAIASDLKDAGIDSPTALVAGYLVHGSIEAWRSELFLQEHKMSPGRPISTVTLLAGPAFFNDAGLGIVEAIDGLRR